MKQHVISVRWLAVATALGALVVAGHSARAGNAAGKILFVSDRDGNAEIYMADEDGANVKRLTNNTTLDFSPAWSPDGQRIAYVSRGTEQNAFVFLRLMSVDGTTDVLLAEIGMGRRFGGSVGWSPDGKKLVYTSSKDGNPEIYSINVDGTDAKNLTQNPARDASPSFSPDGQRIVFTSDRDGNRDIYVMDAAGGNVSRLTSTSDAESAPAWSPDGKEIAYYLFRNGRSELRLMGADGSNDRLLLDAGTLRFGGGLCWSPDGTRIAYVTDKDGNREVYVVRTDGSDPRSISQHPGNDLAPAWWGPK
ncbi:MAG: PD40 domain-containing protein [Planctomycetes bacterium]|nr:PD40 domain-containing protein [Planctomycetota bacterium]